MKLSVGYITAPNKAEARKLAQALVEEKLVACVNILPDAESYFEWDGEVTKQMEAVMIFKTREKNEEKIIKLVKSMHPYECPCVVFLPIASGNADFLKWVDQSC